jgi:membrane-associated phospholipid phosphatase
MAFTEIWAAVTVLGDIRLWILFLLFFAVYMYIAKGHHVAFYKRNEPKFKKWLWVAFLALVIVGLASQGLKELVQAPRICDPATNPYCPESSYAFPSGHAALSFAMFATIPLAAGRKKAWLAMILPLLVGYSRLALEVHTPADVIGGAAVGLVSAAVALKLYGYGKGRKNGRRKQI